MEQPTSSIVRHFNKELRSNYCLNRCCVLMSGHGCHVNQQNSRHLIHFTFHGFSGNKLISFWDALRYCFLNWGQFPCVFFARITTSIMNSIMRTCVCLLINNSFSEYSWTVNAERGKTDHSYCRSINQWFLQSLGTELSTTAMMCSDGCQCSCHAEHQCSSGGDWLSVADCYKTLHFRNNTTTPHCRVIWNR